MSSRRIHVVVVAYDAPDDLDLCLSSLGRSFETTVVDNSSSTAVHEVVQRHGALLIDPGRNLGFGSGVNRALAPIVDGAPRDVLLVNPDAVVTPPDVAALGGYLHRRDHSRVAAVSPRLVAADGAAHRVEWPFPTPWGACLEAIGLGRRVPRSGGTFVIGAVMLMRWEAIVDVGFFDERFFLYAEEADWQRRARARGWTSSVCSAVVATHAGAASSSDERRREALFHAGQELYVRKWHGRGGWAVYRAATCCGALGRAALLRGEGRAQAVRRARLYLRGPRRCAQISGG